MIKYFQSLYDMELSSHEHFEKTIWNLAFDVEILICNYSLQILNLKS